MNGGDMMATTVIKTVFQFRRGKSTEWESVNPVLREGEPAYATDIKRHKIGDGVTAWNDLPYVEGDEFVVNAQTHYEFPSIGKVNVIYKAEAEKQIYQWNPAELKYETLGVGGMSDIEIIDGGRAEE